MGLNLSALADCDGEVWPLFLPEKYVEVRHHGFESREKQFDYVVLKRSSGSIEEEEEKDSGRSERRGGKTRSGETE